MVVFSVFGSHRPKLGRTTRGARGSCLMSGSVSLSAPGRRQRRKTARNAGICSLSINLINNYFNQQEILRRELRLEIDLREAYFGRGLLSLRPHSGQGLVLLFGQRKVVTPRTRNNTVAAHGQALALYNIMPGTPSSNSSHPTKEQSTRTEPSQQQQKKQERPAHERCPDPVVVRYVWVKAGTTFREASTLL